MIVRCEVATGPEAMLMPTPIAVGFPMAHQVSPAPRRPRRRNPAVPHRLPG